MIYEFDALIKIADEAVSITISYEHARTCDDLWITRIVTEDAIDLTMLKDTAVGDSLIDLCIADYESVCEERRHDALESKAADRAIRMYGSDCV